MKNKLAAVAAIALAGAMAVSLAGCGQSDTKLTDEQLKEINNTLDATYDDIVAGMTIGFQSSWKDISTDQVGVTADYMQGTGADFGYCMLDLNEDGINDLVMGSYFAEDGMADTHDYGLYDIYIGKDDGTATHVTGGTRDSYQLYDGAIVGEHGSNGADDSFNKYYEIKDFELSMVDEDTDGSIDKYTLAAVEMVPFNADDQVTNGESVADTDAYMELANTLAVINGIKPGSAGASLRAGEAVEALVSYAAAYGQESSSGVYQEMASIWLQEVDDASNFAECFEEVTSLINSDEELSTDVNLLNVVNGVQAAIDAK